MFTAFLLINQLHYFPDAVILSDFRKPLCMRLLYHPTVFSAIHISIQC